MKFSQILEAMRQINQLPGSQNLTFQNERGHDLGFARPKITDHRSFSYPDKVLVQ